MRAYFSATLNVDQLAFTLTSSYCSSNIDSISGENKGGDILKFEKTGPQKRENGIIYIIGWSVFMAVFITRLGISNLSLSRKVDCHENLDAGKPVGCLPALLDPLGSLLEFLTGFPKCTVRFRVSP